MVEELDVKSPPPRLYGRHISHPLRARQQYLIETVLPKLRLSKKGLVDFPACLGSGYQKIFLEIGFGGGEHILSLLRSYPHIALIASEIFLNGLSSLLSKLFPENGKPFSPLKYLRIFDGDGRVLCEKLPTQIIDRIYLLFPDPWPKKRHAKRRFVHPQIIKSVARIIKKGGLWFIASDDPTYQEWVDLVFAHQNYFELLSRQKEKINGFFQTRYEMKAIKAGLQPIYWIFRRKRDFLGSGE